jgi:hypothetical protein
LPERAKLAHIRARVRLAFKHRRKSKNIVVVNACLRLLIFSVKAWWPWHPNP